MAIKEQVASNGATTYNVSITKRSSVDPRIRVQKLRTGFETLSQAKRAENQLRSEVERELVERETSGSSWQSIVDGYAEALHSGRGLARRVTPITARDYPQDLRAYTQEWMKRPAKSISRHDVREVLERMEAKGKSRGRINHVRTVIHGAFVWGIENGKIPGLQQSPAIGLTMRKVEGKTPEILSLGDIQKLLQYARDCEHPWYPIWAGALLTGMRSGELYALTWKNVDFEHRNITVSHSFNSKAGGIKSTKAGYVRFVPISPDLESILRELKATSKGREFVFPRFRDWTRGMQAAVLRQFCQGAGLPSVCFHALRACFATQLLRDKVAPAVVMKICGWKDLKTMQRYIRLAGIEIEGATDGLKLLSPQETMGRVVSLFRP